MAVFSGRRGVPSSKLGDSRQATGLLIHVEARPKTEGNPQGDAVAGITEPAARILGREARRRAGCSLGKSPRINPILGRAN